MSFIATPKVPIHEVRMNVLTASNNRINLKNEGIKNGNYARVLARRKSDNLFSKQCNINSNRCVIPPNLLTIFNITSPLGICFHDNYMYVAYVVENSIQISKINLVTKVSIPNWAVFPDQPILGSAIQLLVHDNFLYVGIENEIIKLDTSTAVGETWVDNTNGLYFIFGFTVYQNHLYVVNNNFMGTDGRISKINLVTKVIELNLITTNNQMTEFLISLKEYNHSLYIVNYANNSIWKYNLITDQLDKNWITNVGNGCFWLAIHNNTMYVSDFNYTISKINIDTKKIIYNWVVITPLNNSFVPFLILDVYTFNGNVNLYLSGLINDCVYSTLI